jgi:hypothetical protein
MNRERFILISSRFLDALFMELAAFRPLDFR